MRTFYGANLPIIPRTSVPKSGEPVQNRHCYRRKSPIYLRPGGAMPFLRALCVFCALIFAGCASDEEPGYGPSGYGSGGYGSGGGGLAGMGRGETVGTLGGAAAGALLGSQIGK